MNSIERLGATISGRERDRPPISLTLSLYGAKLTSCPLYEYYTDPVKYVEGQIAVYNKIGPDIIFGPFALPLFGKAFGSEVRYFENQAPNIKKPVISNIEDLSVLDFEKAFESDEIRYFTTAVEGLVKNLGDKVMIAPITLSPTDLPIMIMGLDNWLDLVLTDLTRAQQMIVKTGEFFLRLTSTFCELGASFIVLPSVFTNPTIITKSIAIEFQSQLARIFADAKCPLFIHEGGARMIPFLEIYKELPNVGGFIVNSNDSLIDARSLIEKNRLLAGNISGPDLATLSPEQIEAEVRNICNLCYDDVNFIFASSGADIPFDTPIGNILKIRETIESHSQLSSRPVCIACSIFKDEINELRNRYELDMDFSFLSSMLHMRPESLEKRVLNSKEKFLASKRKIILLYGDCCPNMIEVEKGDNVFRTQGMNCIEILLGKERYRTLRKSGAFFLMPEWVGRWEEIFRHELKLEGAVAREFMMDLHTKIIYIDTEQKEIPVNHLKDIEDYTGLKVEIIKTGTDVLAEELRRIVKLMKDGNPKD